MSNLPQPRGWRILVEKPQPKEVTSGGIILSDESRENENYLSIVGKVTALGPMCWCDRETGEPWTGGPWAKVGDWVIIPKFTQLKMVIDEVHYRIINDDEVIAVIDDPSVIQVYP